MLKRIIVFGLALIMSLGFLVGCGSPYDPYEDKKNPVVKSECGNFYVQLYNENKNGMQEGEAVVLELTDVGKTKEVLAIPSHVEGKPVTQVGLATGKIGSHPRSWRIKNYGMDFKIYVPYTVVRVLVIRMGFMNSGTPSIECSEIVFISHEKPNVVVHDNAEERYAISASIKVSIFGNGLSPNLVYDYNYQNAPNSGYYWLDYLTGANQCVNPPAPAREGYSFTGWYLEAECLTRWDGVKPASINENLSLYAGWNKN